MSHTTETLTLEFDWEGKGRRESASAVARSSRELNRKVAFLWGFLGWGQSFQGGLGWEGIVDCVEVQGFGA